MSFPTKRQLDLTGSDNKAFIDVTQLIDLTDKPIGLTRDEIGWSKVRANASNCICCCCNNSITLVTTDASYILDHVPLNDIQFAQANASLQQLAISNHRKLVIIDLVDGNLGDDQSTHNSKHSTNIKETKVVNLAAHGLTMEDIIHWRWLDDHELAIMSYDALYTCHINQQNISHPAFTALTNRSRYLSMERICDVHQHIGAFCQVTDIHRDSTKNLFAISSLYSTRSLLNNLTSSALNAHQRQTTGSPLSNNTGQSLHQTLSLSAALRPSFGSVPSKLSQLTNNNKSFDSLNSENLFDFHRSQDYSTSTYNNSDEDHPGEIYGLAQVYCKLRERSQLVRAHAVTFTTTTNSTGLNNIEARAGSCQTDPNYLPKDGSTILVATNKSEDKIRVHFIEMLTTKGLQTGQNTQQTTRLDRMAYVDFPSSIVCSHLEGPELETPLHVAMITTKYGQLFVCSVAHGAILFNINLTTDIISSTILESKTRGLMVICRNGQILLVKLNLPIIVKLLDERKTLKHTTSLNTFLGSMDIANNNIVSISNSEQTPDTDQDGRSSSPDIVISTKL